MFCSSFRRLLASHEGWLAVSWTPFFGFAILAAKIEENYFLICRFNPLRWRVHAEIHAWIWGCVRTIYLYLSVRLSFRPPTCPKCPFVCLPVLSVLSSVYLSVRPTVLPSVRPTVPPSVRLPVLPSFRPSTYLSFRPSTYPSVRPPVLPSVRLPILPSVHLSFLPFVYLSFRPSTCPSFRSSTCASVRATVRLPVLPSVQLSFLSSVQLSFLSSVQLSFLSSVQLSFLSSVYLSVHSSTCPSVRSPQTLCLIWIIFIPCLVLFWSGFSFSRFLVLLILSSDLTWLANFPYLSFQSLKYQHDGSWHNLYPKQLHTVIAIHTFQKKGLNNFSSETNLCCKVKMEVIIFTFVLLFVPTGLMLF